MEDCLVFENRQKWRNWLTQNHYKSQSAWIVISKKNSAKKGITLDEAVEEAICFGWIDGKLKTRDQETFTLKFTPRKAISVWSKINKKRAEKLILEGKMTPAGLMSVEQAKKNGSWDSAYTNLTLAETPHDLEEALLKEPRAWKNFNEFANSYRNMYVGWVSQAKTAQTRQKRIQTVVEQSLKNKKALFL
jgi:uncharacterized protein YdeI (YjbR/CyaY-like superfamily)